MRETSIRTLGELIDVVQELIDSTGKHVYAEDLQAVLDRVDATADEPDITVGAQPWTDEQLADMRATALQGDLKSARALLESNGYEVRRKDLEQL